VAKRIGSSARRMSRLIDDILDFAKGRLGGGFELRLSDVHDVAEALREVVAEHQLAQPRPGTRRQHRRGPSSGTAIAAGCSSSSPTCWPMHSIHGSTTEPISLSATIDDTSITVTVTNQGEPIPERASPTSSPVLAQFDLHGAPFLGWLLHLATRDRQGARWVAWR
jgi:hypothetical protein